ncbi:MAG: 3-deoxy-manno-octulosonate cytidylyltransferase [Flavobacteriaceae bacterium]|nr:3-deoxy-manno-octulosonate cytidylyltransferase [Flavobacteriaceae bacterium]
MNVIAAIPARYQASRFPGKLLADLAGKPVIQHTYEAVEASGLFTKVYVVTDSDEIENVVHSFGGSVIRSVKEHECGSDRIAEAMVEVDADVVINVQADEPFIQADSLSDLVDVFVNDLDHKIDLASLMIPLKDDLDNPNVVKVITDLKNRALYFSRAAIPFLRSKDSDAVYHKHVGVYAFRKKALLDFYNHPPTPLERAEKIEAIRYLELGKTIQMVPTSFEGVGIDVPEDLEHAKRLLS